MTCASTAQAALNVKTLRRLNVSNYPGPHQCPGLFFFQEHQPR